MLPASEDAGSNDIGRANPHEHEGRQAGVRMTGGDGGSAESTEPSAFIAKSIGSRTAAMLPASEDAGSNDIGRANPHEHEGRQAGVRMAGGDGGSAESTEPSAFIAKSIGSRTAAMLPASEVAGSNDIGRANPHEHGGRQVGVRMAGGDGGSAESTEPSAFIAQCCTVGGCYILKIPAFY